VLSETRNAAFGGETVSRSDNQGQISDLISQDRVHFYASRRTLLLYVLDDARAGGWSPSRSNCHQVGAGSPAVLSAMSAAAKKTIARGGGPPPTGRAKGNPFMTGAWEPVGAEHTNMDLTVTHGAIPHDLNGSFVRTGPNPRFPERHDQRRYHFFSGDAMVHGVELVGGSAHYRNRWVQTRGYRRDLATMGESVGQPAPEDFGKGTGGGNTAMLYHAGRCLALSEGTQGAWQLALPSLDTVGFFTYNDELKHAFTAHPKVCADTGELHFFGEKTAVFFRSSFVLCLSRACLGGSPLAFSWESSKAAVLLRRLRGQRRRRGERPRRAHPLLRCLARRRAAVQGRTCALPPADHGARHGAQP
jgi:hypothetical protein